jgi:hypothetical protein
MLKSVLILFFVFSVGFCHALSILVPMDELQKNHLKAYGLAYYVLKKDITLDWLLNYRGGSFLIPYSSEVENECLVRGVTAEIISDGKNQCYPSRDCQSRSKHECGQA